jgi:hypothetical protein
MILNICTSKPVYSHIWLNPPTNDHHFFYKFLWMISTLTALKFSFKRHFMTSLFFLSFFFFFFWRNISKKPNWTFKIFLLLTAFSFLSSVFFFAHLYLWKTPKLSRFVGLAYQGNDFVFRFMIEYNSLMGFWPLGNRPIFIWGFSEGDTFWLVLKLETSYRVLISWRILVSFRGICDGYIFAWWNIWVSIILLLP